MCNYKLYNKKYCYYCYRINYCINILKYIKFNLSKYIRLFLTLKISLYGIFNKYLFNKS